MLKGSYRYRLSHRRILNKTLIHPLCRATTYFDSVFGRRWYEGSLVLLNEIVFFLFEDDFPIALMYDINLNFYVIYFYLICLLFFLFLGAFYVYNIIWSDNYNYNCDYLWKKFRMSQQLNNTQWNWVKEQATRDILEFYTKQLTSLDYSASYQDLIKSSKAYNELSNQFLEFIKQKDDLLTIFSNLDSIKDKFVVESNKVLTRNKYINHYLYLAELIRKLRLIKSRLGVKISNSLIQELSTSLTFDYIYILMMLSMRIIIKLV